MWDEVSLEGDGAGPSGGEIGRLGRLGAYTYLTVPERAQYIAIMRVFTGSLLSDLSAPEVADRLVEQGLRLPVDVVAARLSSLSGWGVLLPSSRPVRVASIRDYHRARSRFQLTALGERVQRQAEEVIAVADTAREVSRELLGLVAQGLRKLADEAARPGGVDPVRGIGDVSTLFTQFRAFADSVRDFYAYLGQVIFRYDLDSGEFLGFKELLLDYAETITDEVSLYTPQIQESLDDLEPRLPAVLDTFDRADRGLAGLERADLRVERSAGRRLADWDGLRAWFFPEGEQPSQVQQLREATLRALQALLANAKRMIRSSSGELSRRRDLLRLAEWFEAADDATAHDLFVAAFGLYPTRHFGVALDGDHDVPASTSWWNGPVAEVARSVRERGSRAPRGRTAGAENYAEQRDRLLKDAVAEADRRRQAAVELRAAHGRLHQVRLSAAAFALLRELLARAVASAGPGFDTAYCRDDDLDVRLWLLRAEGRRFAIRGVEGTLTIDDYAVDVEAAGFDESGPTQVRESR